MRTARDAIKMVVNTDGAVAANTIEEADGVIRLVNKSAISADHVAIEATRIEAEGRIDVSRTQDKGGTVHILGDEIYLTGAEIAANGDAGGGEILIGGEYQGKGDLRTALYNVMDSTSTIYADAKVAGDGGRVIIWADETTLFDGKIYARGGAEGGDGGFVETSGKINLGIQVGHVNTSAPCGNYGDWLLDPASVVIATGGADTIASASSPNCATAGTVTIDPSVINAAATNVALCSQNASGSSITVTNPVSITTSGVGLSLTAGSTSTGPIALNANITTNGGAIALTGLVTLGAPITLDTTSNT